MSPRPCSPARRPSAAARLGGIGAALSLGLLLLSGCAVPVQAAAMSAPQSPSAGQTVFVERCQVCHGVEGRGLIGPSLDATGHTYEHTDENLYRTITHGTIAGMPSWRDGLSPNEVRQVIAYLKTLWTDQQRDFQTRVTVTGFGGMR